jgi:Tfp pilus assembly protein PilX
MRIALSVRTAPMAPTHRRQRGAAALVVTMMLFFAMVLVAVFVNRNLVFEQRSSANQYRSTQAFEAAEAGLEWAVAQLNHNARLGADCLPSADLAATSFRTRYLGYVPATSGFTPLTWNNAGTASALQPTCVRGASGWSCSCPLNGAPVLAVPALFQVSGVKPDVAGT